MILFSLTTQSSEDVRCLRVMSVGTHGKLVDLISRATSYGVPLSAESAMLWAIEDCALVVMSRFEPDYVPVTRESTDTTTVAGWRP